jgi:ring-1,2-phenylacetyl-CoA epoxidase subunit PaaD
VVTRTARDVAAATPDPELPPLTIADLGILRSVEHEGDTVVATITPTYSGCPALREIGVDLRRRLEAAGFARVEVRTRLAPPWSSDWITAEGRRKLAEAGIAAPHAAGEVARGEVARGEMARGEVGRGEVARGEVAPGEAPRRNGPVPLSLLPARPDVACPRCGSARTVRTSAFGATACKALYRCDDCREPFEYVKEI